MFRFLHAADIHLDSPLRGLERYEGAPVEEIRAAPRRALENLVQLAIDEDVAFVLLAGDLYDGDWKDYNTGLFFIRQMKRLQEAEIAVHLISGNHDAASQITRQLSMPPNVVVYSNHEPETVEITELGVAIHGQGFIKQNVTEDLASAYPLGLAGRFDIGIVHTCLSGRDGHDPYAPTSVAELTSKGYDYWALGHVHKREVVSRDPWIVFPGNLQGRHARETGSKGATLVTVEDAAVVSVEHRPCDVVRWLRVEVDISSVEDPEDIPALARRRIAELDDADRSVLAVRLILTGRSAAHGALVREPERWREEMRAQLAEVGGAQIYLERFKIESRSRIDVDAALGRDDAFGELLRLVDGLEDESFDLGEYVACLGDLRKKLPAELMSSKHPDRFDPSDPACLRELLPDVRELLVTRILDTEELG